MGWRASSVMDEKLRFVFSYERDEESMKALCNRFNISRETGYVWLRRFRQYGVPGLVEVNRAPLRHPNQTAVEVEGYGPAQSRPGTGIEPYVFIVRAGKVIICNHHLRWGQLPSAGPRQKEGAEMESGESWTGLVWGLRLPTLFAMRLRKRWGTSFQWRGKEGLPADSA